MTEVNVNGLSYCFEGFTILKAAVLSIRFSSSAAALPLYAVACNDIDTFLASLVNFGV